MTTILVIDDSPTEAEFVRNMLETEGIRVLWASDAKEGIEMAIEYLPDVILMDVVMPGMNGYQATRQLKRLLQTAEIPILMLTTKDQETDKMWNLRTGATAYICKPPQRVELLREINRLLG